MAEFRWPEPLDPPKWEPIYYPEYNAVQYVIETPWVNVGPFYLIDDRFFGDPEWHEYDDGDTIIRGEN